MGSLCGQKVIQKHLESTNNLKDDILKDEFIDYTKVKLEEFIFTDFGAEGIVKNHELRIVDNRQRYAKYLKAVNNTITNTDKSIKNILSNLYFRQKNNKNRKKGEQSQAYIDPSQKQVGEDIIKYFIFFYTADQVYSEYFNKQIRKDKYKEIAEIINILSPYISKQINIDQRNQILKESNNLVYKGYPSMVDQRILHLKQMKAGAINYFPSFFLAELRENNVKSNNSWITIKVNPRLGHEFLAVKPPFCEPNEKKFIIFPFFCFEKEEDSVQFNGSNKISLKFKQAIPRDQKMQQQKGQKNNMRESTQKILNKSQKKT